MDNIISLIKDIKQSHISPKRFDVSRSGDSYLNQVLSHVNSKFLATEIPKDYFRIAATSRLALSFTYKQLNRQKMILKALMLHAELVKDQFLTEDKSEAQELIKLYILLIDAQIESMHDTIRKIRSIVLLKFIPMSLKKIIVAAPILSDKIWKLSPHMQIKIWAARSEYIKGIF